MKNNKITIAQNSFESGLNCAQSIISAYTDELEIDKTLALDLASGFGGGMGRLQETCGAVTGAFMIIGLVNSRKIYDEGIRSEKTHSDIQDYANHFTKIHGTIKCGELLGCDLKTAEGQEYFTNNNLGNTICQTCISNSISFLERIIT